MFSPTAGFSSDASSAYNSEMIGLFWHGLRRARQQQRRALRTGTCRQLHRLADLWQCFTIANRYSRGLRSVPLSAVQGSVDRDEFDIDFLPLHPRMQERWTMVAALLGSGRGLPPVELIEVGGAYYVVDGHHRVSAARMLGFMEIEAVVTHLDLVQCCA